MKRQKSTRASTDPIPAMAERTRLMFELLPKLAMTVAANEEAQRKFRNAVLIRLSRIETMVSMIQAAQLAQTPPHLYYDHERLMKDAKDAEAYIAEKSNELGLVMVKYIYGQSEIKGTGQKDRRK